MLIYLYSELWKKKSHMQKYEDFVLELGCVFWILFVEEMS